MTSSGELDWVTALASEEGRSGIWIGLRFFQGSLMWSDSSPLAVVYWAPDLINHKNWTRLSCAYITNDYRTDPGYWSLASCKEEKLFACKAPARVASVFDWNPNYSCEEGMIAYAEYCYYFVESPSPGNDVNRCSKRDDGEVLRIDTLPEMYLVKSMLAQRQNETFWTSLTFDTDTGFLKWLPTFNVELTHSQLGLNMFNQASDKLHKKLCGYIKMDHSIHRMHLTDCNEKHKVLCRKFSHSIFIPYESWEEYLAKPSPICPYEGSVQLPEHPACLWFSGEKNKKSWKKAEAYCRKLGGHLYTAFDEIVALKNIERWYNETGIWVGYYVTKSEDGKPAVYDVNGKVPTIKKFFAKSQAKAHTCAFLDYSINGVSMDTCHTHRSFICQTKMSHERLPQPQIQEEPLIPCENEENWYFFNGYCYFYSSVLKSFSNTTQDWYSSRDYCVKNGGDLVSIHFGDEVDFLVKLARTKISDNRLESTVWIGTREDKKTKRFTWTDKSLMNFEWWNPNGVTSNYKDRCVVLDWKQGNWNIKNCEVHQRFMCKKSSEKSIVVLKQNTTAQYGDCDYMWHPIGKKCVRFYSSRKSWTRANTACKRYGGALVTVASQYEQNYLNVLNRGNVRYWIGLKDNGNGYDFAWADGSDILYTNWATNEPNDHLMYTREDCVEALGVRARGEWNDIVCSRTKSYVCQKPRGTRSSGHSNGTFPKNCSSGYTGFKNGCYKFFGADKAERLNWNDAQATCLRYGGIIVTINGFAELMDVYSITVNYKSRIWIGYSDADIKNNYQTWTDGTPMRLAYSYFAENKLRISSKIQCISMGIDGRWIYGQCNRKRAFVCEQHRGVFPTVEVTNYNRCPANYLNWIDLGTDKCYKFYFTQRNWQDSSRSCQMLGKTAELASVNSNQESGALFSYYEKSAVPTLGFWIGLYKSVISDWKWTDHSAANFTKISPNVTISGNARCVNIKLGKWRVDDCTNLNHYICSVKKDFPEMENLKLEIKQEKRQSEIEGDYDVNDGMVIGLIVGGIALITVIAFILIFIKLRKQDPYNDVGVSYRRGSESERLAFAKQH